MKYPRIWIAAHGGEIGAATQEDAPTQALAILGRSDNNIVRCHVARHPNTSADTLAEMAAGPGWQLLLDQYLAANPKTPKAALREIFVRVRPRPGGNDVMWDFARNPNTPIDILKAIAEEYSRKAWAPLRDLIDENIRSRRQ